MNISLHLADESDAYLDVFPEYAMGVPPKGLNTQFVHEIASSTPVSAMISSSLSRLIVSAIFRSPLLMQVARDGFPFADHPLSRSPVMALLLFKRGRYYAKRPFKAILTTILLLYFHSKA